MPDLARGKLYWITNQAADGPGANPNPGTLYSSNLDGTGVTIIGGATPSPATDYPASSLNIDPVTQKLYWVVQNRTGSAPYPWSIRWSKTDGTSGGTLYSSTTTTQMETGSGTSPIVIDHAHNRIWWGNFSRDDQPPHADDPTIGFANLDGTGA